MSARVFEDKPATRERVPLLIGLVGPSGGGKTFSAFRLATGIQRVAGGDIYMVDTEARRGLHYADRFKFRHVEFSAPFGPLDYLAAIEHCVRKGARTIIVDSMSHEHEGPGGVLEQHAAEHERLGGKDGTKMLAWARPKAGRRRLINSLLQMPCNFVFCFRAKEKIKLATKAEKAAGEEALKPLGWMPIAGEEFVFEMTVNALLLPNAGGIPTWQTNEPGERMMIKLPEQFRKLLLAERVPLSEELGERMAQWAAGDVAPSPKFEEFSAAIAAASTLDALNTLRPVLQQAKDAKETTPVENRRLREAFVAREKELSA
jgi:ABC-type dipeptide/oligopeptide/nickel transport system ATPase subunit